MGPLKGSWYAPVSTSFGQQNESAASVEDGGGEGIGKEYVYDDEEEEGEVAESEGRWKR